MCVVSQRKATRWVGGEAEPIKSNCPLYTKLAIAHSRFRSFPWCLASKLFSHSLYPTTAAKPSLYQSLLIFSLLYYIYRILARSFTLLCSQFSRRVFATIVITSIHVRNPERNASANLRTQARGILILSDVTEALLSYIWSRMWRERESERELESSRIHVTKFRR